MSKITRECIAFDIMKNKMMSRGTYEEMVEYCKNLKYVYVYSSINQQATEIERLTSKLNKIKEILDE